MDMKLEVVPIPVRDVDAAKDFYTRQVGFGLDHDVRPNENMRVVQMTPPGSACSVVIGEGLPLGEPGSVKGVQLVVGNLDAVRTELAGQGVGISEVQQMGPEGTPGSRYCFFEDPDGNMWAIQRSEEHTSELQSRLHLVCRLLLEKKKKISITKYPHFSIIVITRPPFTPPSYVPPTYHSDTTLVPGIDVLRVHG